MSFCIINSFELNHSQVLKIKIKTVFWEHDPSSCCSKRVRECLFSQYKQGELSGAQGLKISLAVWSKPLCVFFNVFPQGWTDPVLEALCFSFYVKHEMMDEVKNVADSKQ
jgi:hypothetical protein